MERRLDRGQIIKSRISIQIEVKIVSSKKGKTIRNQMRRRHERRKKKERGRAKRRRLVSPHLIDDFSKKRASGTGTERDREIERD